MTEERQRRQLDRRWLALAAVCVPLIMTMLDGTAVNVALASIQRVLHTSLSELQWVMSAYTLMWAVLMLTAGSLVDRYGSRRVLVAGISLFTLASMACGTAMSGLALVIARAAQGVGAAAMAPASLAIIARLFSPAERGRAVGLWSGTSSLALALGPIIGGAITQGIGWRWIFYLNVPIALVGILMLYRFFDDRAETSSPRGTDLWGVFVSAVALFSLTFALIEGDNFGWRSPAIVALFCCSGVGFLAFVGLERHRQTPMIDLRLFRSKLFRSANAVHAMSSASAFATMFVLSLFLQQVKGYSALSAGATFLPWPVVYLLLAPIAGRMADRFGSRWIVTSGMLVIATSLTLLSTLTASTAPPLILVGLLLGGSGIAFVISPTTAAGLRAVTSTGSGIGSAVLNTSRQVGSVLAVALSGAILSAGEHAALLAGSSRAAAFAHGMSWAFRVAALIALLASAVAALGLSRSGVLEPATARAELRG